MSGTNRKSAVCAKSSGLLLVVLTTACGDVQGPKLAGVYELTEVSGSTMPVTLSNSLVILSGELQLADDGFKETLTFTNASVPSTVIFEGEYAVRGGRVHLSGNEHDYIHVLEERNGNLVTTARGSTLADLDILRIYKYTPK